MTINSISTADVRQDILSSSDPTQRKTLQTLQDVLAGGDLNAAQSQFQVLRNLFQNSATVNGSSLSSSTQISTQLSTLSSALSSGNLTTARSAFAIFLRGVNVFG